MDKSFFKLSVHVLIYSLCFVSWDCSHQKEEILKLDGEWMLEAKRINVSQTDLGLYCINDTLYSITGDGILTFLGRFQIHNDTIVIKNYESRIRDLKYIIKKHTNDSLILLINGKEREFHNRRLEFNDSLNYKRITVVIGSESNPYAIIKLNNSGLVCTEKKINKTMIVLKTFRLNTKEINTIDSLFKSSCLDSTDTEDWSSGYDGWKKSMKFEYNNRVIIIKTNGFTMPYRIDPIFYHLTKAVADRKAL